MQRERQTPVFCGDIQRIHKLQRILSGDLRRLGSKHVQNGVVAGFDTRGVAAAN
jgi:hypothetical protein